jgi:hypothetical protein
MGASASSITPARRRTSRARLTARTSCAYRWTSPTRRCSPQPKLTSCIPRWSRGLIEKTHAALVAAAPESSDQVKAAEATVARLSTELARLVEAVRHGGAIPALVSEIQRLEIERTRAEAQLAALRTPAPMLTADDLPAAIERVLTDWRGLLRRQTAQARQILRRLLHRRVVFTPDLRAGTWTMRAECSLGRGYSVQRLWWPQRGSNPCFSLERAVS